MSTIETRLRPSTFDELVGLPKLKERLTWALQSAQAMSKPFPHTLLMGPPGSGKSTIAHLIAEALGDPIMVISKPVPSKEIVRRLSHFGAGIVFLDEVHLLGKAQDELLSLLEGGELDNGYASIPFPWITVIAATTEREKVHKAFLDRFPIRNQREPYTDDDLTCIAGLMARKAGIALPADLLAGIGRAAGGIPRNARQLILFAEELVHAGQEPRLEYLLELSDFEDDGLTGEHVDYLNALEANGGRAGEKALSKRLRLPPSIVNDLEALLLDRGLVHADTTGRLITPAGRARIGTTPQLKRVS